MNKRIGRVEGIIDCHTHCGGIDVNNFYNLRYPCTQSAYVLHELMANNNINYAITFPMPSSLYFDTQKYWIEKRFIPSGFESIPFCIENQYLLSEIDFWGYGSILPFVSFSLRDKINEQCDFIRELSYKHNIYGLKHHTKADQIGIDKYEKYGTPILELAKDLNFPIMIHSDLNGISSAVHVFNIASKYPSVRFCLAHFAGFSKLFFRELVEYNKNYNNIFFDSAPSLFLIENIDWSDEIIDIDYSTPSKVLGYFLDEFNDSFLWGTDSPWTFASALEDSMKHIYSYYDEIELRKVSETKHSCFSINTANRFLFGY